MNGTEAIEARGEAAAAIDPPAKRGGTPLLANSHYSARYSGRFSQRAPFLVFSAALVLYLGLCFYILHAELRATGTLTFPLDDVYITMALAKNLAFHGVWGLGRAGFQSATSTLGYLLVLSAAYRVFGPSEWMPLALSIAGGILALFAAQRLLSRTSILVQSVGLAAMIFFAPLHVIGVLGMEHTLHTCLALVFLNLFSASYAQSKFPSWALLLLTAFLVSVRYEGLFFAAGAVLLLLLQGRLGAAIALGAAAAAPVVIYGIISELNGCYWLPHSVSLKGLSGQVASHSPLEPLRHVGAMLHDAPYLGALAIVMLILLSFPSIWSDARRRAVLAVTVIGTALHLALASTGWTYRYEAYLVATGIVAIAYAAPGIDFRAASRRWALAACVLIAGLGSILLYQRTVEANVTLPMRSLAIYCQQIQMARFLGQFEQGVTVAANDVGAINYFADIHSVDLAGLSDKEIFWLKKHGAYTTAAMNDLTTRRGTKIAILYDSWFSQTKSAVTAGPALPTSWIRVQRWVTPNAIFLGDGVVSFYATSPEDAAALSRALAQFDATSLPRIDRIVPN